MPMDHSDFERAVFQFDSVHRADPETVFWHGSELPRACLYHKRLNYWVEHFVEHASEPLRLAAHCQHLRRWVILRADYPEGTAGYRQWRKALSDFHVQEANSILREAGYTDTTVGQVRDFLTKKNLKSDPEMQLFEDAICLVFFEIDFANFAHKHNRDKLTRILRKVWIKMSENGREMAPLIAKHFPKELKNLFDEVIGQAGERIRDEGRTE
jgi:hypothetical protein